MKVNSCHKPKNGIRKATTVSVRDRKPTNRTNKTVRIQYHWSPTSPMQNAKTDFLGEKANSHYIYRVNEQPTCSNAFEIKADVKQRSLKRNDNSRMEVLPRSTYAEEASTWLK